MNFYQRLAILCMRDKVSRITLMRLVRNLFASTLAETNLEIDKLKDSVALDGIIVSKSKADSQVFILESGDRTVYITETFLAGCAPDWRKQLREAMQELSKDDSQPFDGELFSKNS